MNSAPLPWLENRHKNKNPAAVNRGLNIIPENIWQEVRAFHEKIPGYHKTPLRLLKNLSAKLGVGGIWVKDEAERFGLDSFKVLGGTYAVYKSLAALLGKSVDELSYADLFTPENREKIAHVTFAAATAGNHGKGLAWAAKKLGCKAMIYVNKYTTPGRIQALEKQGAIVTVIDGNYDASVHAVKADAAKNGWHVIADTAWEGYQEVPQWIMQGYTTLLAEAQDDLEEHGISAPTHLFVQAGVGSFAGAAVGFYTAKFPEHPPLSVVVEPENAACYLASAQMEDGKQHVVEGDLATMMAGLACGEPNPLAWELLKNCAEYFLCCPDNVSAEGMRQYANPLGDDPRIISGESGAVTLGVLMNLLQNPADEELRAALQLDKNSQILLINTEGATDPANYQKITEGSLA